MSDHEVNAQDRDARRVQRNDSLQIVSFKLDDDEYGVEITKVKEIILHEGVTKVPQMPDFIVGIINLRGNVIPVIDLRERFGLARSERDDQTRIMVTRMESRIVGMIVDSVSQVMKIPKSNIQPPPSTIAGLAGKYLQGIGKIDEKMIMLLDIERIMSANERVSLTRTSDDANASSPAPAPLESMVATP